MMKLYSVNAGYFKLDGGAMFGVVPKSIWNRLNPADENNLCTWAMRCVLAQTDERLILIDNGMGDKQDAKFFSYYHPFGDDTLVGAIRKLGFEPSDVTDVLMTHLHFDHCGGGVKWNAQRTDFELTFPNANYWTNPTHWQLALHPNAREKASFLEENLLPIEASGHLKFIEQPGEWINGINLQFVNGHTDAMMIPLIEYAPGKKLIYMADLIASSYHLKPAYVMGYDMRPLDTMLEKQQMLEWALAQEATLFFEHDPQVECITVKRTEKGIVQDQAFLLSDIMM